MSFQAYQTFIDQFCKYAGLPDPRAMYTEAQFRVGSTDFSMRHGGERAPEMVTVYCALGDLPPPHQREAALLRLLESNLFLFGSGSNPCFAFNPENGKVLLTFAVWLGNASGLRTLEQLNRFDLLAKDWREGYFLDAQNSAADAVAAPNVGGRRGLPPSLARVHAASAPSH